MIISLGTNIEQIDSTPTHKRLVPAKVFKCSNLFKDITARAMTRTPVLGVAAMGGIEAAHVAHEVKNGKNFFEESAGTWGPVRFFLYLKELFCYNILVTMDS